MQRWTKSSEGRILAVSRPGKSESQATIGGIPGSPVRTSFAKIREPLEVPNLLALQTESFDWLVGNAAWKERQAREASSSGLAALSGLEEILGEISPIEDFSGSMSLSFSSPRFEDVKASIEECKDKDMTYAAPLFVTAEFTNNTTGEIKSQTVFMGDF
ncbi:MAG: DNA-directed polymerase subunit beta, partial [Pseudonocardiales bacterium]|nr:DNA-directed polymerase subunit beta [Pseudonocardiales bacterium]